MVGSMFKYAKHRVEFINELIHKHGSKFEFSMAGKKVVVIHGYKNLAVFYDESNITRTKLLPQQKELLGGGTDQIALFLDGQEHVHRKRFLMSMVRNLHDNYLQQLDSKSVQEYIPTIDRIILDVLSGWCVDKSISVSNRLLEFSTQLNIKYTIHSNSLIRQRVLLGYDHTGYLKLKDTYRKQVVKIIEGFKAKVPSHNPVSTYGKALKGVDKLNQLFEHRLQYVSLTLLIPTENFMKI